MKSCAWRVIGWSTVLALCAAAPRVAFAQDLSSISLSAKAAVARAGIQPPQVDPSTVAISPNEFHRFSPTLQALYVVTATIQGLDARSTFKALDAGAVETNSIVKPFASNRVAFVALKASMSAAFIYQAHETSKRHKIGAIIALGIVNSIYTAIAVNNYRALHVMQASR
jgi:hypothetical protein